MLGATLFFLGSIRKPILVLDVYYFCVYLLTLSRDVGKASPVWHWT